MKHFLSGFLMLALLLPVAGAEPNDENYDRLNLTAEARTEVANDLLVATLFAQASGSKPARPAREVSNAIRWALNQLKGDAAITASTRNYTTSPAYDRKGKIDAWRVRQTLSLASGDAEQLGTAIGKLQERLAVESIQYQLTPATRQRVEDELIVAALARFKARAKLVSEQFDAPDYRLVRINVNTGQSSQPRPLAMARSMAAEAMPAPAITAGKQTLSVNVNGTIELQR